MDISAQPVKEDHFAYAGQLLIDPGNAKHYPRAPEARLKDLLALDSNTPAEKDETAPFYEAQLLHYGLKRTKNKATAKWRLLEAIRSGSLTVPEDMKTVETRLKRSYGAASRKMKDTQGASGPSTPAKPAGRGTASATQPSKRKPDTVENSKPVKKSKASSAGDEHGPSGPSKPAKPATKATASGPKSKPTEIAPPNKVAASKPTTATPAGPPKTAPTPTVKRPLQAARCRRGGYQGSMPIRPPTGSTAIARNTAVNSFFPQPTQGSADSAAPASVRPRQWARRSRPFPRHIPLGRVKKSSEEPDDFFHDSGAQHSDTGTTLDDSKDDFIANLPGKITGDWDISCPEMEREFNADCTLVLLYVSATGPGKSSDVVWGKFDLDAFYGVFKARSIKTRSKKYAKFVFEWRGRGTDGAISFGPGNTGEFTLRDDGYMEGFFGGMWGDSLEFEGQKGTSRAAEEDLLEYEWNQYNEENYEFERVARWR